MRPLAVPPPGAILVLAPPPTTNFKAARMADGGDDDSVVPLRPDSHGHGPSRYVAAVGALTSNTWS
jgi:hypothetical protein